MIVLVQLEKTQPKTTTTLDIRKYFVAIIIGIHPSGSHKCEPCYLFSCVCCVSVCLCLEASRKEKKIVEVVEREKEKKERKISRKLRVSCLLVERKVPRRWRRRRTAISTPDANGLRKPRLLPPPPAPPPSSSSSLFLLILSLHFHKRFGKRKRN